MLKAYQVLNKYNTRAEVVICESAGKAKSFYGAVDADSFVDVKIKRFPEYDQFIEGRSCVATLNTIKKQQVLRDAGWHEDDDCRDYCVECGLGVWGMLSESILDDDGLCLECRGLYDK